MQHSHLINHQQHNTKVILWLIPFHHAYGWDHSTEVYCMHQIQHPHKSHFIEYVILAKGKMADKK